MFYHGPRPPESICLAGGLSLYMLSRGGGLGVGGALTMAVALAVTVTVTVTVMGGRGTPSTR